ncbi:hypothetical protein AAFF_G00302560 [Aldrovandia affinis]|uniref:Uncharacterized protein n=1 Tax=Aldrovandia affinis TaxID=143900 RepID=A0AAD7W1H2_9TELE|nr:hypothetical protein AAFF_G00302560 [Aldrovandia affinis]
MVTSLDVNLLAEDDIPGDLLNEFRHHSTDEEEGGEADPPMEDRADLSNNQPSSSKRTGRRYCATASVTG